jgi:outer membrane lipoprotein-sorting protein
MSVFKVDRIASQISAYGAAVIITIIARLRASFWRGTLFLKPQRTGPLREETASPAEFAQFTCNSGADLHEGAQHGHDYRLRRTHMTPRYFALALIPALMCPAVAPAQTDQLSAVSAHLKAVTSMTATFSQTDRKGKTLTGQLSLKRPGKIRFQYQDGVPILVVADGNALIFVDYQVKQVQRWPIGNTPLNVLLNPNRDLREIARVVPNADPRIVVVEVIDKKRPEFGVISLAFTKSESSPGGLLLQGWSAIDAQKNRTNIRLSNQRFNMPISDQAFKWRDPRPKTPGR